MILLYGSETLTVYPALVGPIGGKVNASYPNYPRDFFHILHTTTNSMLCIT